MTDGVGAWSCKRKQCGHTFWATNPTTCPRCHRPITERRPPGLNDIVPKNIEMVARFWAKEAGNPAQPKKQTATSVRTGDRWLEVTVEDYAAFVQQLCALRRVVHAANVYVTEMRHSSSPAGPEKALIALTLAVGAEVALRHSLRPKPPVLIGSCSVCGRMTEGHGGPRKVACKWGRCNGTVFLSPVAT